MDNEEKKIDDKVQSKIKRKTTPEINENAYENYCVSCGRNKKVNGYDYCSGCLDKAIHKKTPALAKFCCIVAVIACLAAALFTFLNIAPAKRVLEARKAYEEHRIEDAYNAYEDAFSLADELNEQLGVKIVNVGRSIRAEEADVVAEKYVPYYSYTFLKQYYTDDEIKADPGMSVYFDENERYTQTYSKISDYLSGCADGSIKTEDALKEIKALEADAGDGLFWILYAESYIELTYNQADDERQLELLDAMYEKCPEEEWYYNSCYGELYFSLGMYDKCVDACRKQLEANRNDAGAYAHLMKIAFLNDDKPAAEQVLSEFTEYNDKNTNYYVLKSMMLRRFGDLDGADKVCDTGINENAGEPELYRQRAINQLCRGQYGEAYDSVYNAYVTAYNLYEYGASDALSSELIETTYVITKLYAKNGDGLAQYNSDLSSVLTSFEGFDEMISDNSKALLAGEKTASQIFMEGSGDLS